MSPQQDSATGDRWISTANVAELLAVSLATAKRRVDTWRARGFPRVRRTTLGHGHFGYEVHAGDFDSYCAGDSPTG